MNRSRGARPSRWVAGLVAVVVVAGIGFVAGRGVMPPAADQGLAAEPVVVEVAERTVGSSLSLTASVLRDGEVVARSRMPGVVTELTVDGSALVSSGDRLVLVDERPVLVVEGAVPFFRDLESGLEGRDVEQLRRWLVGEGFELDGQGAFDAEVETAVRAWQEEQGVPVTGTVEVGTFVAVEGLPRRLGLVEDVEVGSTLTGDDEVVIAVADEPRFELRVSPGQVDLIADTAVAMIDGRWEALLTDRRTEDGEVVFALEGPDGGPPCGDGCDEVAVAGSATLPVELVSVPEVTGPAVPIASVTTRADGSAQVVLADGSVRTVEVRGAAGGFAVIEGVEVGEVVRVVREEAGS